MIRNLATGAARTVLPQEMYDRLKGERDRRRRQREIRYPPAVDIDLAPLDLLREASAAELLDPEYLEHRLLPALGLNDEYLEEFPRELRSYTGKGLRYWQYPSQFSKYLVEVARFAPESYLEIGVRHGGTFALTVSYLERVSRLRYALGMDILQAPGLVAFSRQRSGIEVRQLDSQGRRFARLLRRKGPFDLALIDGDHDPDPVRRDFELVKPHARMLAFHDIANEGMPGVVDVWRRLKTEHRDEYAFYEFVDQYEEVTARMGATFLGIGLAVRKA